MPRLFVAVWPPPELVAQLAALPRPDMAGLRWTRPEQWHVTLRFLGSVAEGEPVIEALASMAAAPVEAMAGPATGRFGQRVLHLPVGGLADLAAGVVRATQLLGKEPEHRPFAGHLTLARVAPGARVDLRPLAGVPVGGRWPVREVTLVESRLSPSGPRYQVVKRFPLAG